MKNNYTPFKGFYDLRAFDIPKIEFKKLANVQEFLFISEKDRIAGKFKHNLLELDKIKQLSAEYQQILFSYKIIKPELI